MSERRRAAFEAWMASHAADLQPWCAAVPGRHSSGFLCGRLQSLASDYQRVHGPAGLEQLAALLESYGRLRQEGYLAADLQLLGAKRDFLLAQASARSGDAALKSAARRLVQQLAFEWEWERAESALAQFAAAAAIGPREAQEIRDEIEAYRDGAAGWARRSHALVNGP